MESWIKGKLPLIYLLYGAIILLAGFLLVENTKSVILNPYYDDQLKAAWLMKECLEAIKEERFKMGIPLKIELDPNQTGIIGEEYTEITTTLGNLPAKRTSTNPAFAALLVKYFKEANLKEGSMVAIGASGSFPALILATLCAAKVLNIEPLLIYSIGASQYGANIPEFTFVPMLDYLNEKGILPYCLLAISMGGDLDQAKGMLYSDSREIMQKIAEDSEATFILSDDIVENIQRRIQLYELAAGKKAIKAFVNIGGATPNYGNTVASITYPNGLVIKGPKIPDDPGRGLIFEYQSRGIPVIHLLNIRDLALKEGLPIDPVPLPTPGEGGVYRQVIYNKFIIILVMGIEFIYLIWVFKRRDKLRT